MNNKIEILEYLRGFASLYVFLAHILVPALIGSSLTIFLKLGQEAVILFFILSGFVIHYASSGRGLNSFADYFVRRFRRIFPIMIITMIASYGIVCIIHGGLADFNSLQFLGNLLMLQDSASLKPAVIVDTYQGNMPLWSLSYEWWFYMYYFPLMVYLGEKRSNLVVGVLGIAGAATYVAFPNPVSRFLLYYPLWWIGVELARCYMAHGKLVFSEVRTAYFLLGGVLATYLLSLIVIGLPKQIVIGTHPILQFRHLCAGFAFVTAALSMGRMGYKIALRVFSIFGWLAPMSYALYIIHFPLLKLSEHFAKEHLLAANLLVVLPTALGLAWFLEVWLQKYFNKWIRLRKPEKRLAT